MQIQSATVEGVVGTTQGWNLAAGSGFRSFTWFIPFVPAFPANSGPVVTGSIVELDVAQGANIRGQLDVGAANNVPLQQGVNLTLSTWWDTQVNSCRVNWLAIAN